MHSHYYHYYFAQLHKNTITQEPTAIGGRNYAGEISSQNVQWVAPGGAVTCKLHKIQDPDGPELKSSKNLGKIQMAQIASFVEHGQT